MSMNERIHKIDQILSNRSTGISVQDLLERLEVSPATLKRDIAFMRNVHNAPIVFNSELGGYIFDSKECIAGAKYQLPGLWFSAEEIHALLTMQHLLSNLDTGGLLGPHIRPLRSRLTALLSTTDHSASEIRNRIKFEKAGIRHFHLDHFEKVGSALLGRKRIVIDYLARASNKLTRREISPQRLVYYRGNWYLDAWCHLRNEIRSFALDAIQNVELLEIHAEDIDDQTLDEVLGSGYGIFSGGDLQWATLLFTPEHARWVSSEYWHPEQKGQILDDGSYELQVPYSKDTELIMDILRHGASVQVMAPPELRDKVMAEHARAAKLYA